MGDTAIWCVAVLLASAGVAADGYLAWTFMRDWRVGRAEERARREMWRAGRGTEGAFAAGRPAPLTQDVSQGTRPLRVFAGLAAVGLATGVAAAQQPASLSNAQHPATDAALSASTAQTPQENQPADAAKPAPPANASDVGSAVSVQINLDFTNAYFYRGIRQQDKGLIVQPAARLTARLVDEDAFTLDGFIGTWNSFGPNGGTQTGGLIEDWYESDLYAGFTLTRGRVSLTTSYTFLTSPSDAFQEVQELGVTLALDDSEWLKAWALKPYATLAIETGSNGSDGPDLDNGTYLEFGIAPGFSFDVGETPITLTFPASVGLSLSDYYQDAGGSDDTFGFAQAGARASIPLGEPGRFGTWTLNAGVSVLFLGDHTKAFNNGDGTEVIGTIGLQWNF
jgi:hypothetical protein